jgi:hypothetical protein
VTARLAAGDKVMGFGHRVYKTEDPRATHLRQLSKAMGELAGDTRWYDMTVAMERAVKDAKGLYPNVDLFAASVYHSLGIPIDLFTPVFAVSRMAGWTAHVIEQQLDNRLIRPESEYVGLRVRCGCRSRSAPPCRPPTPRRDRAHGVRRRPGPGRRGRRRAALRGRRRRLERGLRRALGLRSGPPADPRPGPARRRAVPRRLAARRTAAGFQRAARRRHETTLLCTEEALAGLPAPQSSEPGWRRITFPGPLPWQMVGFLADVAGRLAAARIPLAAMAGFTTDHVLVRDAHAELAMSVLEGNPPPPPRPGTSPVGAPGTGT